MRRSRVFVALRNKLPSLHDILSLYGTIVFLIYGWAIVAFFWKLHSWLYFLSIGEILAILCYTLASSLLESALILGVMLLVGFILPSRWFFDKLVSRGSLVFCALTFWVALFNLVTLIQLPTSNDILSFGLVALLTIGLAILIAERMPAVEKMLLAFFRRLIVFLYLWLPLSLVSILVLLFRIL